MRSLLLLIPLALTLLSGTVSANNGRSSVAFCARTGCGLPADQETTCQPGQVACPPTVCEPTACPDPAPCPDTAATTAPSYEFRKRKLNGEVVKPRGGKKRIILVPVTE